MSKGNLYKDSLELSNYFDFTRILEIQVVDDVTVIHRQQKPYDGHEEICRLCIAMEFEDTRQVQGLELCNNYYSFISDSKLLIPREHISYADRDMSLHLRNISLDNPEIVILINSLTSRSIPFHFHAEIINYNFLVKHSIVTKIMARSVRVEDLTTDGNYLVISGEIWLINDLLSKVCTEKSFGAKDLCGLISTINRSYYEEILRNLKTLHQVNIFAISPL